MTFLEPFLRGQIWVQAFLARIHPSSGPSLLRWLQVLFYYPNSECILGYSKTSKITLLSQPFFEQSAVFSWPCPVTLSEKWWLPHSSAGCPSLWHCPRVSHVGHCKLWRLSLPPHHTQPRVFHPADAQTNETNDTGAMSESRNRHFLIIQALTVQCVNYLCVFSLFWCHL